MPLMDAFWGDRYGQLKDPFGHTWEIATLKKMCQKRNWKRPQKKPFKNWEMSINLRQISRI